MKDFVYLGGNISGEASSEQDVKRRVSCACGVKQNLRPVWKSKEIGMETKIRVYEAMVLSVLLCNSETWTLKETTKKKLLVFETSCLSRIKGAARRDRIRNTDIRAELRVNSDVVQKI